MSKRDKTHRHLLFILFLLPFLFCSCSNKKQTKVNAGIYYWKTVFALENSEEKWLKDNQIRKLYLRVFDVDWNESIGQPLPIGDLQIKTNDLPQDI